MTEYVPIAAHINPHKIIFYQSLELRERTGERKIVAGNDIGGHRSNPHCEHICRFAVAAGSHT